MIKKIDFVNVTKLRRLQHLGTLYLNIIVTQCIIPLLQLYDFVISQVSFLIPTQKYKIKFG